MMLLNAIKDVTWDNLRCICSWLLITILHDSSKLYCSGMTCMRITVMLLLGHLQVLLCLQLTRKKTFHHVLILSDSCHISCWVFSVFTWTNLYLIVCMFTYIMDHQSMISRKDLFCNKIVQQFSIKELNEWTDLCLCHYSFLHENIRTESNPISVAKWNVLLHCKKKMIEANLLWNSVHCQNYLNTTYNTHSSLCWLFTGTELKPVWTMHSISFMVKLPKWWHLSCFDCISFQNI